MDYTNSNYILMQSAQSSIAKTVDTGNQFYDLIYTVLIMSVISTVINNFRGFNLNFLKGTCCYKKGRKLLQRRISCFKKRSELIFEATLIPKFRGNTVMDTTKAFDCILDHLNERGITEGVFSKSELKNTASSNRGRFVDEYGDIVENTAQDNVSYSFSYGTTIEIEKGVFIEFTDRTESNNESVDGKSVETTRKISMIVIHSYSKNITYLEKIVNDIYVKYIRKLDSKFARQMHYLSYHGFKDKNDRRPTWKSYPFNTVKNYDNFFCEDKENIFKQIENIRNSKQEYERCGKPYQINILIHSPHFGCGKTSLLKLLAKMFGNGEKKRHIVDINLSKIKKCSELEDIFLCNEQILGQTIDNDERIYIVDELDKISNILLKDEYKEETLHEKIICNMKKYMESEKTNKEKEKEYEGLMKLTSKTTVENHPNNDSLHLGFILSLIDGPIEYHDRIMIFTANDIERLHPALLRSGRMDVKIELKKANRDVIGQIISHIFDYEIDNDEIETQLNRIQDYEFSQSDIMTECLKIKKHNYDTIEEKEKDILEVISFFCNEN